MRNSIPDGITREHVIRALSDFDSGQPHDFGESTGYDLTFEGRSYPPKAIVGIAASYVTGSQLGPYDFKGGLESKCFKLLTQLGFSVIPKQEVAGSTEQTAWLLIAFDDDERQHAGNEGYADDTERSYTWDSKVPNSKQIRVGDLAVLRSKRLLGVARIENIAEAAGQKPIKRCPSCSRTAIKERSQKLPKFRCHKCHHEFDEPIREDVDVTEYEAGFGDSFVACPDALAIEVLRKACPNYNGQLAMQQIDLETLGSQLINQEPKVAALLEPKPATSGLVVEAVEADSEGAFDATDENDARRKTLRAIAIRQGQPAFRKGLLEAYERRCAVTGCDAEQALEAAHILPYKGEATNHPQNGMLLRSDIHTLFDRQLLAIDPATLRVLLHPSLRDGSYSELHRAPLRVPKREALRPSTEALERQRSGCDF